VGAGASPGDGGGVDAGGLGAGWDAGEGLGAGGVGVGWDTGEGSGAGGVGVGWDTGEGSGAGGVGVGWDTGQGSGDGGGGAGCDTGEGPGAGRDSATCADADAPSARDAGAYPDTVDADPGSGGTGCGAGTGAGEGPGAGKGPGGGVSGSGAGGTGGGAGAGVGPGDGPGSPGTGTSGCGEGPAGPGGGTMGPGTGAGAVPPRWISDRPPSLPTLPSPSGLPVFCSVIEMALLRHGDRDPRRPAGRPQSCAAGRWPTAPNSLPSLGSRWARADPSTRRTGRRLTRHGYAARVIAGAVLCPAAPLLIPGVAEAVAAEQPGLAVAVRTAADGLSLRSEKILVVTAGRCTGWTPQLPFVLGPDPFRRSDRPGGPGGPGAPRASGGPDGPDGPEYPSCPDCPGWSSAPSLASGPWPAAGSLWAPGTWVGRVLLPDALLAVLEVGDGDLDALAPAVAAARFADDRTGVLVLADGATSHLSATSPDAPPEGFERSLTTALATGDPARLSAWCRNNRTPGHRLGATAPRSLAVLAELAGGRRWTAAARYLGAPFGVGYHIASWWP